MMTICRYLHCFDDCVLTLRKPLCKKMLCFVKCLFIHGLFGMWGYYINIKMEVSNCILDMMFIGISFTDAALKCGQNSVFAM